MLTFFNLINKNIEPYIGREKQQLTFIYIKDLARAVFQATESDAVNKAYFVSDGSSYPQNALGENIKELLNKKTLRINVPVSLARVVALVAEMANKISGKPSMLNQEKMNELQSLSWKCENEPLQIETGFSAEYNLKQGLTETVAWYKKEGWL